MKQFLKGKTAVLVSDGLWAPLVQLTPPPFMIIADDHGGATNVKFSDLCSPKAGHAPTHSRNAVRPPPFMF